MATSSVIPLIEYQIHLSFFTGCTSIAVSIIAISNCLILFFSSTFGMSFVPISIQTTLITPIIADKNQGTDLSALLILLPLEGLVLYLVKTPCSEC